MQWIDVNIMSKPIGPFILVAHPYGVEAIVFDRAAWRYWYTGKIVPTEVLKTITHWCKPENPHVRCKTD